MSFTMFWSVIACAYYYLLCKQIEDFTPVKKAIQTIFFFTILLFITQGFGKDTLLNFNQKTPVIVGLIGNRMISSSFICILAPFLISNPLNWIALFIISFITWSSGAVLAIGAGFSIYAWNKFKRFRVLIVVLAILAPVLLALHKGTFYEFNKSGRGPAWARCIKLSLGHPQGYGVGTFKLIFPVLSNDLISTLGHNPSPHIDNWEYENTKGRGLRWGQAHNAYLQILFETGFLGLGLFMAWMISIVLKIVRNKEYLKLAGLVIVATNAMTAFPDRMPQTALILMMLFAWFEHKEIICGKR